VLSITVERVAGEVTATPADIPLATGLLVTPPLVRSAVVIVCVAEHVDCPPAAIVPLQVFLPTAGSRTCRPVRAAVPELSTR